MSKHVRARSDMFQRNVERVLDIAANHNSVSLRDAYSYSRSIILCSLLKPETHFAAVAILVISISTSIFMPYGATDIISRIGLFSAAMFIGTSLSIFILYLLLPLHLLRDISLWSIAVIHCLIAAATFGLIEPALIRNFVAYPVPLFLEVFVPFFLLSVLVDDYILWLFKDQICARAYRRRHRSDTIETLLPSEKRGEVWLISAADHYVEISTRHGSHMHRMTMKAAVEKVGPDKGIRVHRSHWVAFNAMLSIEKNGERFFLTLRNGHKVPASPKQAAQVQCHLDAISKPAAQ